MNVVSYGNELYKLLMTRKLGLLFIPSCNGGKVVACKKLLSLDKKLNGIILLSFPTVS